MIKAHKWSTGAAAVVAFCCLAIAACGSNSGSDSGSNSGSDSASQKPVDIAYLPGILANPYVQASLTEAQAVAAKDNAVITPIDSNFDAQTQFSQMQDAIASGKYNAIMVAAIDGNALRPLVLDAIKKGIKVGAIDVPLGPSNTTSAIQIPGVSVSVLRPFGTHGTNMGKMTVSACEHVNPCKVGFIYGIKATPPDQAVRSEFDAAIAGAPNVKVTAEAECQYSRAGGLTAMQDMLQANADLNVIVGPDQCLLGGQSALSAAGLTGKVKIIGWSGTKQGVAAVVAGQWYGDSVETPITEARIAFTELIDAVRTGKSYPGQDAVDLSGAPNGGAVTRQNASQFTAQYSG